VSKVDENLFNTGEQLKIQYESLEIDLRGALYIKEYSVFKNRWNEILNLDLLR